MKLDKFTHARQSMHQLEMYATRDGVFQQSAAVYKVLFTLCFIVTVISMPKYDWPAMIPFFAFPVMGIYFIGLPLRLFLRRLSIIIPFVVFFGAANLFFDTETVFYSAGFGMKGGVASFIVLFLKAVLTVGAVQLLVASTAMNAIAGALAFLRVPGLFTMQLILTWRFAGLLVSQAGKMSNATQLRGSGSRGLSYRVWPQFMGSFLLKCILRSKAVADAMNCRLFDVRNTYFERPRFHLREFLGWLIACCLCIMLRILL